MEKVRQCALAVRQAAITLNDLTITRRGGVRSCGTIECEMNRGCGICWLAAVVPRARFVTGVCCALGVLLLGSACFHPTYDHPMCGPNGACPTGLECSTQGTCEPRGGSAGGDDAGADAPGDACTPPSFSSQVDTCGLALDTDLTLTGSVTYDTLTHVLQVGGVVMAVSHMTLMAKAGEVDAIFARNVRLTAGAGLVATGPLPFAIVASGSVTLDGSAAIDVGHGGAGALAVCSTPPAAGSNNLGGAGGGGGGGYGADGGRGGTGSSGAAMGGRGSDSIGMLTGPTGGCPGAAGGIGSGSGAAAGGPGGGALYIVAAGSITLGDMAVLTAAGGGGRGGGIAKGGGGGGGSGGMIFLEAPHVTGTTSQIAANGGGGGEGGDGASAGNDGIQGSSSITRAEGGTGGAPLGSDGGRGGSLEEPGGEDVFATLAGGGGGGGGAVGYVHIVSSDVQLGTVSPASL